MIAHNLPTIGIEEEEAAIRVLRSKQLSQGEEVEKFENEFCDYIGLPHGSAVALSSGTSSLFLSLKILNATKKNVVFPGYVCSALRHAVSLVGGYEKIIDIKNNSPNIDFKNIERIGSEISIIPHMYGIPIEINGTESMIIEDCCQALGAKVMNKMVGLQGDVGIYSFYATKLITSGGQGGMLISTNQKYVDAARDYREFDYRNDKKNRFNFQMTDIQAAIGRIQLKKLPNFIKRREEIFQYYKKAGLNLLDINEKDFGKLEPVRYRAILKTDKPRKLLKSLNDLGVNSIIPTEDWELLDDWKFLPNSLKFSRETLSLPIYPTLTNEQLDIILSGIIIK